MRSYYYVAGTLLACLSVAFPLAFLATAAQNGGAPPSASPSSFGAKATKYGIAVVDTGYIYKNFQKFNQQREILQQEFEKRKAELLKERDEFLREQEALRGQFAPGSNEFKRKDEELTKKKTEITVRMEKFEKDIREKEMQMYFQASQDLERAVGQHAQRHGIVLVIRFNGDPVNANDPKDVQRGVNQPILYQDSIDITADVLALLQAVAAPPSQARAPAPANPQQPRK